MTPLPGGWRRLLGVWRLAPERDVDAELAFHLDERVAELVALGADAVAARAQAIAEFGDMATVRRGLVSIDTRIARQRGISDRLEWLGQDFRHVVRSLRRSPGFVVMVSLTLALGLGANAAIFSLLDRLFLQPPAGVASPEQVRRVYRLDPGSMSRRSHLDGPVPEIETSSVFSFDDFDHVASTLPAGVVLGGYTTDRLKLGRGEGASELKVSFVLRDYFAVLGVEPKFGRFISGDDARVAPLAEVVVLSDAAWRTRFGARPDIIGQLAEIQFHKYVIIGIAPPDFRGPDNDAIDAWLPMSAMQWRMGGRPNWYSGNGNAWIRTLARLAPGPLTAAALVRSATAAFRTSTLYPDSLVTTKLAPLTEAGIPGFGQKEVTIAIRLAGVAVIILLIACANVANLFLARGLRRRREIAMRLALGVGRGRLISFLLTESVVVALIGASVALLVAIWGAAALRNQLMPETQWVGSAVNVRVMCFTMALAVVTGMLAGIVPALRSSRPDLAGTLRGGGRDSVLQRSRASSVLLVAQAALSVVLLAGAGLFVRSLRSVEGEDIGYDGGQLVFASIAVDPDHRERTVEAERRLPELQGQLRKIPGVERTALTWLAPFEGFSMLDLALPGRDSLPHVAAVGPFASFVSPEFFATMGMHIRHGRGLTASDHYGDGLAVVVNESMARSYWPGRDPVGECIRLEARKGQCTTIVGVVSDAHFNGIIEKPSMHLYAPAADSGRWAAQVIALRAMPGQAAAVTEQVRRVLRAEFAGWAEANVHPMSDNLATELRSWRTGAALFSAAGILALLVAIVGVYSTISYTFSQRTHEIGIRVALGARTGNVIRLVVGAGVRIVLVGVAVGVALSLAASRLVESMLYKTSPRDPAVLIAVSCVLLLVAVTACLVPAWRALRVDPASALRAD